VEIQKKRT